MSIDPVHEQRRAAMLSFATTIVLMLVVYVALIDAGPALQKAIFAFVTVGVGTAIVAARHQATPTRKLAHPAKVRREQRHVAMTSGTLIAALLLLAYTAAFDLDSWSEWTVFGALVLTTLGAGIAVQTCPGPTKKQP